MTDLEKRLRDELTRRADHAPRDGALAEQIIATARTQANPYERRRGWSTWTLPLIAAAGVAAIVTGVFVGVDQLRDTASAPNPPGTSLSGSTRPSPSVSAPTPDRTPSSPTKDASASATQPQKSANIPPDNTVGLNNFTASDLTFYGDSDGWALGTADCLNGSGRCPAMVHTTDGGKQWTSMPQPPGSAGDITGIRFATDRIGYAYGPSRLELTTNGGKTWTTQAGGAYALETLDGNVIRVVASGTGCPGPCDIGIEYADIGSSTWTSVALSTSRVDAGQVFLARSDSDAYVMVHSGDASRAEDEVPILFASGDDGRTWQQRGTICAQPKDVDGSFSLAASPGGTVTVLCHSYVHDTDYLVSSTDRGANFRRGATDVPGAGLNLLAGDPSAVLVVVSDSGAYRSSDGGASWHHIADVTGTATFVGFESTTLGRIVTDDGRTIWTTTDAGLHWSAFTFPS